MEALGAAGDAAEVGYGDEELDGGEVEVQAGGAWGGGGRHGGRRLGGRRGGGNGDSPLIERRRQLWISHVTSRARTAIESMPRQAPYSHGGPAAQWKRFAHQNMCRRTGLRNIETCRSAYV